MQHHPSGAEGHVPVVGLVKVVVQTHYAARGAIGPVRLDHLTAVGNPGPAIGLHEAAPLVAEHLRGDFVDTGDHAGLHYFGHHSTSNWQWSPSITRTARGRVCDRVSSTSRPTSESSSRGMSRITERSMITECSTSELTIWQ